MAESDATTKQSARYRNKYIPNKVLPRERISNKKFAFEQLNHRTGSGYRTNCCNNDDYATTVTLVQVSQRALRRAPLFRLSDSSLGGDWRWWR